MKDIPPWVTYTVMRLLLIAVPLVVLLVLQVPWWLAAIIAAVVGLCLSYLLLGKSRNAVSTGIYTARTREKAPVAADDDADAEAEDAIVDSSERQRESEEHAEGKPGDPGQLKR